MPFAIALGLEVLSGDETGVVGRAGWAEDRLTVGAALHGGYLMGLADCVGAMAAATHLPPGAGTSTIESKTNFYRGVTEGGIVIMAEPMHAGRTTIVVQTDIVRSDGKLVTRSTQTQAVITQKSR